MNEVWGIFLVKTKRIIILTIILLLLACPLAAAFFMATGGHLPHPLPPLTPILSPTVFEFFTSIPTEQPISTPAAAPIFATHAPIETQFAATSVALTPAFAKE